MYILRVYLDIAPSFCMNYVILSARQPYEIFSSIISILEMRTPEHREAKILA